MLKRLASPGLVSSAYAEAEFGVAGAVSPYLTYWGEDHIAQLHLIEKLLFRAEIYYFALKSCMEQTQEGPKLNAEALAYIMDAVVQEIKLLAPQQQLLLPGGWVDEDEAETTLMYIIEKDVSHAEHQTYTFSVCNVVTGQGLAQYHPSSVKDAPKTKYMSCLRLTSIAKERITNPVFMTLLLKMLMNPSEAHNHEVLYSGLLPWLTGFTLREALDRTASGQSNQTQHWGEQIHFSWRTPARGGRNTSGWRSTFEAVRAMLSSRGVSVDQLKQLSLAMRFELMNKVSEDLAVVINPKLSLPRSSALMTLLASLPLVKMVDGQIENVSAFGLSGKKIGIFFSGHWCPPSRNFTPVLISLFNSMQAETDKWEICNRTQIECIAEIKDHEKNGTSASEEANDLRLKYKEAQQEQSLLKYRPWEIVFVSSDQSYEQFKDYMKDMPWLAIDFARDSDKSIRECACTCSL